MRIHDTQQYGLFSSFSCKSHEKLYCNMLCVIISLNDVFYDSKNKNDLHSTTLQIWKKAKLLLTNTELSIAEIAKKLTYDPSNFGKFFKKFTGQTAGEFRKQINKS